MIFRIICIFISIFYINSAFADKEKCSSFINSIWEGEKVGKGYQGKITIKFKDKCSKAAFGKDIEIKYDWVGSTGKIVTPGVLRFKENGKINYKNNAGSKGKVTLNDDRLNWKNIFTGNNYNVDVYKQ